MADTVIDSVEQGSCGPMGDRDDERLNDMDAYLLPTEASLLDSEDGIRVLFKKLNNRARVLFIYTCDNYGNGFM